MQEYSSTEHKVTNIRNSRKESTSPQLKRRLAVKEKCSLLSRTNLKRVIPERHVTRELKDWTPVTVARTTEELRTVQPKKYLEFGGTSRFLKTTGTTSCQGGEWLVSYKSDRRERPAG